MAVVTALEALRYIVMILDPAAAAGRCRSLSTSHIRAIADAAAKAIDGAMSPAS